MKQHHWELTTSALKDVEEAVNYYNKHSFGLGNKFLIELDNTIKKIARNPFSFSIKYDEVRWAALKKFPFSVHFTIDEKIKLTTIVAVFNTHQEPFW